MTANRLVSRILHGFMKKIKDIARKSHGEPWKPSWLTNFVEMIIFNGGFLTEKLQSRHFFQEKSGLIYSCQVIMEDRNLWKREKWSKSKKLNKISITAPNSKVRPKIYLEYSNLLIKRSDANKSQSHVKKRGTYSTYYCIYVLTYFYLFRM